MDIHIEGDRIYVEFGFDDYAGKDTNELHKVAADQVRTYFDLLQKTIGCSKSLLDIDIYFRMDVGYDGLSISFSLLAD